MTKIITKIKYSILANMGFYDNAFLAGLAWTCAGFGFYLTYYAFTIIF